MDVKSELLARWREAGEWWVGEPQREFVRFIDAQGIRREEERLLPCIGRFKSDPAKPEDEDYRDEWNLRLRKTRDEKVARACGLIPKERVLGEEEETFPSLAKRKAAEETLPSLAKRKAIGEGGVRGGRSGAQTELLLPQNRAPGHPSPGSLRSPASPTRGEAVSKLTPMPARGEADTLDAKEEALAQPHYIREELAPYGISRKDVGRAKRLQALGEGRAPTSRLIESGDKSPHSKSHPPISNLHSPIADPQSSYPTPNTQNPTPSSHDRQSQIVNRKSAESAIRNPQSTIPYAPLHLYSGYAFGRGTMLAEEIPLICASAGITAAAIADPFSLVGCVEFVKRSKAAGIKPLVGTSVQLPDGGWLVLIAKSRVGYQSLSELLSACHQDEPRQFPMATWERLERYSRDLICLTGGDIGPLDRLVTRGRYAEARNLLDSLAGMYGRTNLFIEIERSYLPWEISKNKALLRLAEELEITPVAGGVVTHARPEHFPSQDILVCAETLCTVDEIVGRKPRRDLSQPQFGQRPERSLNAERCLRTPREMAELFSDLSDMSDSSDKSNLLSNTLLVVDRCDDEVLPGRTRLPEIFPDPCHALREIVWAGAHQHHSQITPRLKKRLEHELERITRLNFSDHFLAIWDACRWAKEQGIQLSGRGSVVDSAVAYCLGLSRIDAFKHNLHFDRFLPADGSKRPDIDVDFEARRRDDVRAYFANKYGHENVAGIAAIGAYCTRGIIREVGKVLGLPNDVIGFLAKKVHGGIPPDQLESALSKRPELARSGIPKERFRWVFELSERLMDIPRNMRSHSSGLIISSRPIRETAPVMWSASPFARERIPNDVRFTIDDLRLDGENGEGCKGGEDCFRINSRDSHNPHHPHNPHLHPDLRKSQIVNRKSSDLFPIIQWDKRSAKHFFDKFDILCLRGQDVLSGTQERIRLRAPDFNVEQIPSDDEETYRAMRSGELIGIPQSASPAMRQAHIRLRTQDLHDASLVQAGIRPGVGGAVKINELIARRRGKPYSFEHPELERILGLTYGIIVFQEQVDQLLQTFCGYTSGEAEDLRESIHKRRSEDYGRQMKQQLVSRVIANGFSAVVAEQVYDYVSGFKGYGFAQGHALAFAEISIRSIYCQQNFPAEYFASLLTAQPAGYYGECTLCNEARNRGVKMLPPDINRSGVTFGVEDVKSNMDPRIVLPNAAIRVGLMQIHGLSRETRERIAGMTNDECRMRNGEDLRFAIDDLRNDGKECMDGRDCMDRKGCSGSDPSIPLNPICPDPQEFNRKSSIVNRTSNRFSSFFDFVAKVRPDRDELENLILCGALDSIHPNRRAMLWVIPRAMEYADLRMTICDLRFESQEATFTSPSMGIGVNLDSASPLVGEVGEHSEPGEGVRSGAKFTAVPSMGESVSFTSPLVGEVGEHSEPGEGERERPIGIESLAHNGVPKTSRKGAKPLRNAKESCVAPPTCDLRPDVVNRKSQIVNPVLPLDIPEPDLPAGIADFSDAEKAVFERSLLGLDVERHLMAFERERVASRGGITAAEAKKLPAGRKAIVVGNPIRLRFPPTPSGKRVVFFDLEDETGLLNVTCFDATYRRDGHAIVCSPYVTIIGVAQDRDGHTAFLAQRVFAYHPVLGKLTPADTPLPLATADFLAQ